jgi:hypothetical protein
MLKCLGYLFSTINRLDHYLGGTGSWSLLRHEQFLADAVIASLNKDEQLTCKTQLEQKYFVDRSNPQINAIYFYTKPDNLKLAAEPFDDALFKVKLTVDGKRETANVTFYEGFIFSVETRHHRKSYEDTDLVVIDVKAGKPKQTYTRIIDQLEHGDE